MKNPYLKHLSTESAVEIANVAIQVSEEHDNDAAEMDPMDRFISGAESKGKSAALLDILLAKLTIDEMSELTALAILGRKGADETLEDWNLLLASAYAQQNSSGNDTSYLSSKLPLGAYLLNGFKEIGIAYGVEPS